MAKIKNPYDNFIFKLETIDGKILEVELGHGYIKEFGDYYLYKNDNKKLVIPSRLVKKIWRYKHNAK